MKFISWNAQWNCVILKKGFLEFVEQQKPEARALFARDEGSSRASRFGVVRVSVSLLEFGGEAILARQFSRKWNRSTFATE